MGMPLYGIPLFTLFFLFSISGKFFPNLIDEKLHGLFFHVHIKSQGTDKRKQLKIFPVILLLPSKDLLGGAEPADQVFL